MSVRDLIKNKGCLEQRGTITMANTDLYAEYLRSEGYRPEVADDLVWFKHEGGNFAICIDDDDPEYFQLTYPNFWKIESEAERQAAIRSADDVTRRCKVAKVYVRTDGDDVFADVEEFLGRREDFQPIFPRAVSALHLATRLFVEDMKKWRT
jgi:hypothetical protein